MLCKNLTNIILRITVANCAALIDVNAVILPPTSGLKPLPAKTVT